MVSVVDIMGFQFQGRTEERSCYSFLTTFQGEPENLALNLSEYRHYFGDRMKQTLFVQFYAVGWISS